MLTVPYNTTVHDCKQGVANVNPFPIISCITEVVSRKIVKIYIAACEF